MRPPIVLESGAMNESLRPSPGLVRMRVRLAILASCIFLTRTAQEPWIHHHDGHKEHEHHDHGRGIVHTHWPEGPISPSLDKFARSRGAHFLDAAVVVTALIDVPGVTARTYVPSERAPKLQ